MMEKRLAFVLGGGGARGALQVGALRALFEAGYQPDLLVGASIGAVNAAVLALWGVNLDRGAVSNLPVEPAGKLGATEIIALDLNDPALWIGNIHGSNQIANKLVFNVIQRQRYMETAFAEAQGVPVNCVALRSSPPAPIWDFNAYKDLIETGYELPLGRFWIGI